MAPSAIESVPDSGNGGGGRKHMSQKSAGFERPFRLSRPRTVNDHVEIGIDSRTLSTNSLDGHVRWKALEVKVPDHSRGRRRRERDEDPLRVDNADVSPSKSPSRVHPGARRKVENSSPQKRVNKRSPHRRTRDRGKKDSSPGRRRPSAGSSSRPALWCDDDGIATVRLSCKAGDALCIQPALNSATRPLVQCYDDGTASLRLPCQTGDDGVTSLRLPCEKGDAIYQPVTGSKPSAEIPARGGGIGGVASGALYRISLALEGPLNLMCGAGKRGGICSWVDEDLMDMRSGCNMVELDRVLMHNGERRVAGGAEDRRGTRMRDVFSAATQGRVRQPKPQPPPAPLKKLKKMEPPAPTMRLNLPNPPRRCSSWDTTAGIGSLYPSGKGTTYLSAGSMSAESAPVVPNESLKPQRPVAPLLGLLPVGLAPPGAHSELEGTYVRHRIDELYRRRVVDGVRTNVPCHCEREKEGIEHMYSEVAGEMFMLRGKNYLSDRKKYPSAESMFACLGVDSNTREKGLHPSDNLNWCSRAGSYLHQLDDVCQQAGIARPFLLVVNLILPWGNLVSYFYRPDVPENGPYKTSSANEPHERAWRAFMEGNEELRNQQFKFIPNISAGPWVIKKLVGSQPALIGQKLPVSYYGSVQENYLEICLDVTRGSSIANSISNSVAGKADAVSVDMAFVVQAATGDTLPERLLGAFRLHHLRLKI